MPSYAQWAKTTSSGSSEILLRFTKNALNSAIFGPILKMFVYTHILGCWEHIFGKKLKIGEKLQNLQYTY